MSFMMAFGWAGVMICIGIYLRAKIPVLRSMLVPASVAAGILGFGFVNFFIYAGISIGTDTQTYTAIVNHLFTISFISITLAEEGLGKKKRHVIKGAAALGIIWCLLYALTPLIAAGILAALGGYTDVNMVYGMLVPFAFCQGPGQAAAYGEIFEQYGWQNASAVALAFASIGFIAAFLIGIPAAKAGIKKGIARHCVKLDEAVQRGYLKKNEQTEYGVRETTCSSSIETLAFHSALTGVCYILAVGISRILGFLPGFMGTSMSGMMFMNGMYAACLVKWVMKKLKIDFLQDTALQGRITGWTADYLIVCAFMSVSVSAVREWLVPIIIVSAVTVIVTFFVCFYFGQRIGGENDFERTLGLYGTCTGTVPSGISLVRIVDPCFETATAVELGACNFVMLASTPVYFIILALASGSITRPEAALLLAACVLIYLTALKITKSWGAKTYTWL